MPNKNRKNKYFNRNQSRPFQNGNNGGNGGGWHGIHNAGVQKKWNGSRYDGGSGGGGGGGRKVYINPAVIDALDEAEAPHSSNYNSQQHHRFDERRKKNRMMDRLKEMGMVKQKLSIGDTDQEVKKTLPESKPHCQLSCMPSEIFALMVSYVQKYFNCFDSNRESLLEAYNSKCMFSFSLNQNYPDWHRTFKFDEFMCKENRNLKRVVNLDEHQQERRYRLLHQGKVDTVNFLNKLPPTEHEPSSFKLDVCYFMPTLIAFSLNGVFREGSLTDKVRPIRSFQRIFTCIPDVNTQMSIVNEEFILTNATRDQYKKYYPVVEPVKTEQVPVDVVPPQQQPTSTTILDPILANLRPEQVVMIQQFSMESRLNLEWSKHCLDHTQWNYEEAAKQFLQHKDKIPKEAFLS